MVASTALANDWEAEERGRDAAIEKWISDQLSGRSCTVVLALYNWPALDIMKYFSIQESSHAQC
jgi:hypothetical protein